MTHIRTQFRAALKTRLTGSPEAGSRVFNRRTLPLPKDLQPTFVFSMQSERSQDLDTDGSQEREGQVRVTAVVKGDDEASEDLLDTMALFVEGVFSTEPTFGGLVESYEYQTTEFALAGEADRPLCTAAFTFAVTFYTQRGDPETSL